MWSSGFRHSSQGGRWTQSRTTFQSCAMSRLALSISAGPTTHGPLWNSSLRLMTASSPTKPCSSLPSEQSHTGLQQRFLSHKGPMSELSTIILTAPQIVVRTWANGTCFRLPSSASAMYDTPAHLAQQLVRHAPKRISRLLDPSVGKGALLRPLLRRLERHHSEVVCVDTDTDALNELSSGLRDRQFHGTYVNEDFLNWGLRQQAASFDCVLMNPPFAATRSDCRTVDLPQSIFDQYKPSAPVPIEAAFMCVAHRLLAVGGRLLAVLPCSVIMSESLQWLRSFLVHTGSIEYVYEFPPRTFKTVESKVYVLVFKKGVRRHRIELIKPQFNRTDTLSVMVNGQIPHRLDFDYHDGWVRMETLTRNTSLGWKPLCQAARIFRGTVPSVPRPKGVVHSTDFRLGRWRRPADDPKVDTARGRICPSDLLIRRVGRNSHLTIGDASLVAGLLATDCLFIIRPNQGIASRRLLFALKSIVGLDWLSTVLVRGTGANYFCKSSLEQLPVPLAAPDAYADSYLNFVHAQDSGCADCASTAISTATECLAHQSGQLGSKPSGQCLQCALPAHHVPRRPGVPLDPAASIYGGPLR